MKNKIKRYRVVEENCKWWHVLLIIFGGIIAVISGLYCFSNLLVKNNLPLLWFIVFLSGVVLILVFTYLSMGKKTQSKWRK